MLKNNVLIIGLGRVGLPLALVLANKGLKVLGADIDKNLIDTLDEMRMPFYEKGAKNLLSKYYGKNFTTVEFSKINTSIAKFSFIIVTVGTPINEKHKPDMQSVIKLIKNLLPYFIENQTLILRSTLVPGTTELLIKLIDTHSKLRVGKNFFVAYCPERIAEGSSIDELNQIPQIIGSDDDKSNNKATYLFNKIGIRILKSDTRSAELAKIFSNVYRYVNFSLANEFMYLSEEQNRSIYKIVNLVNQGYKRGGLNLPGLTAGPCLTKDGFFLDKFYSRISYSSWKTSDSTPMYLVKKINEKVELKNKKVAVLGLTFKKNIDDIRDSLSLKFSNLLIAKGANVVEYDPFISTITFDQAIKGADVLIFAVNHDKFKNINLEHIFKLLNPNCLVCDIWNMFKTDNLFYEFKQLLK